MIQSFPRPRNRRTGLGLGALTAGALVSLAGCTVPVSVSIPDDTVAPDGTNRTGSSPAPSDRSPSSTAPRPTPAASSATSSASTTARPELRNVSGGTVTNAKSVSVSGRGSTQIHLSRKGDFRVVAQLDCSRCKGSVIVTGPNRTSPYADTTGPIEESYLVDELQGDPAKQTLSVRATGLWRLTFISWNRLPIQHGKQTGHGSHGFVLGDRATQMRLTYRPEKKGQFFDCRVFGIPKGATYFGDDVAFAETEDVRLPAIMAILTRGSWTAGPV